VSAEELKKLLDIAPKVPAGLTVQEWITAATVFVLLVSLLVLVVRVIPKSLERREANELVAAEARAAERKRLEEARDHERANDMQIFVGQLELQRAAATDALKEIAATHERAVERLHDRLDHLGRDVQSTRRDILKLDCFHPQAAQIADTWSGTERRKAPRNGNGAGPRE
jgi:hypothetical protein